jgi:hypothetical protein
MPTPLPAEELAELRRAIHDLRTDVDHALRMIAHLLERVDAIAPPPEPAVPSGGEAHINGQLETSEEEVAWHAD